MSSEVQRPSPDPASGAGPLLEEQLCFSLYTASRLVTRAYAPVLAELGLTYPQYVTMIALWETDGPVSVGDLGSRLRLDSGTLTPLLKRLEAQGLVTRVRDLDDERRVLIQLTDRGTALQRAACVIPERMARRFGADPGQLTGLKRILDGLVEALDPVPATTAGASRSTQVIRQGRNSAATGTEHTGRP